jgi:hypothetical protein
MPPPSQPRPMSIIADAGECGVRHLCPQLQFNVRTPVSHVCLAIHEQPSSCLGAEPAQDMAATFLAVAQQMQCSLCIATDMQIMTVSASRFQYMMRLQHPRCLVSSSGSLSIAAKVHGSSCLQSKSNTTSALDSWMLAQSAVFTLCHSAVAEHTRTGSTSPNTVCSLACTRTVSMP